MDSMRSNSNFAWRLPALSDTRNGTLSLNICRQQNSNAAARSAREKRASTKKTDATASPAMTAAMTVILKA